VAKGGGLGLTHRSLAGDIPGVNVGVVGLEQADAVRLAGRRRSVQRGAGHGHQVGGRAVGAALQQRTHHICRPGQVPQAGRALELLRKCTK
jgi:hypothetical protein